MYLQIRRYQVKTGTAQQVIKQSAENFTPMLRKLPGFVDQLLIQTVDGGVMAISIFKDKTGADQSRKIAQDWVRQNLSSQLPESPEVIEGNIVFEGSMDQKILKSAA